MRFVEIVDCEGRALPLCIRRERAGDCEAPAAATAAA